MPERPKGVDSKSTVSLWHRGFESLSLRHFIKKFRSLFFYARQTFLRTIYRRGTFATLIQANSIAKGYEIFQLGQGNGSRAPDSAIGIKPVAPEFQIKIWRKIMNEDELPMKLDLKANLKVDSKDAAGCINKLIETISAACSWLAAGREPIVEAKADTKATLIRAAAVEPLMKTLGITKEEAVALVFRSEQRELCQSIRQQRNIEAIVQGAMFMLPESVNEQPVDEDWTADFFEQCKNVSNEKMQSVWSKVLAGEVTHPGSFSRRTLSFVRKLSQREADLFTKFCSLVWSSEPSGSMFAIYSHIDELWNYGITYDDSCELDSLGLLRFNTDSSMIFEWNTGGERLSYFEESYNLRPVNSNSLTNHVRALLLTGLGRELAPISGAQKNEEYKLYAIKWLKDIGIHVEPSGSI
jgi:hypothetical protein